MDDDKLPQEQLTGQVEDAGPGPDDYMTQWGRRCNALSDQVWKWCQIAAGAVMGVGCAACLFFMKSEGFLPINFLLAFVIAKMGPDILEKWFERKMPKARVALLIALAASLVGYAAVKLIQGDFTA